MIPARTNGRTFLFRVPPKADLYEYLSDFCVKKKIRFGVVNAIGALSKVTIGYYDQKRKAYAKTTLDDEFEILSANGNVSVKDGKPFLHVHVALSDIRMRGLGGHLFPGSEVFSAEVHIQEIKGRALVRRMDADAGLPLWTCRAVL